MKNHLRGTFAAVFVLVLAVVLRSWFFLSYDESYFDSDQAIVGLMAKHLSEGRAWPLFFYGQEYMLGVEAWVMAPVFAVLGPSVFALRLTMVLINLVTGLVLWRLLVRDGGLTPGWAALASSPFVLAPFVTSAHLVEAQGGNPEPFLWVLVAWMVRDRPLLLGSVLGISFLHREFSMYAAPALLAVQVLERRIAAGELTRRWVQTLLAFVVTYQGINALKPWADLLGPGTAGIPIPTAAGGNITSLLARAAVDPSAWPARFGALLSEHVPMLVGLDGYRPTLIAINSWAHVGWRELLPFGSALALVVLAWVAADLVVKRNTRGAWLPLYLAAVAVQSGVVYAATRDPSMFTFRYGLLMLWLPVALVALAVQAWRPAGLQIAGGVLAGLLAAASLVDHVRVIQHARVEPPVPHLTQMALALENNGIHVARAGYWRAYAVTFLSGERVIVASTALQRIKSYQDLAAAQPDGGVIVQDDPCDGRMEVGTAGRWHLCR